MRMRLVIALGGNALLRRGEVPSAGIQLTHVTAAVEALAPLAQQHDVIITHGNGPQVGLLARESAQDASLPRSYPFDVLGAQTQGMVGYFLLQALENALPGQQVASLICQTLVDPDDAAFKDPTKFIGPVYDEAEGRRLARLWNWQIRQDGAAWRRVVPSPEPQALVELPTIRTLVGDAVVVICAGGGGIPVCRNAQGLLHGVEAVIDKDLTAALLAQELHADALLLLTDVDAVQAAFGTPQARSIRHTSAAAMRTESFATGSMGPKVDAACRFVEATGNRAMIGRLEDAVELLSGAKGTIIEKATTSSRMQPITAGIT